MSSEKPTFQREVEDLDNLIPRPSPDPRDPLRWPTSKKFVIIAVLCVAGIAGYAAPLCGQLNLVQQSKLYHKTTVQVAYANSAASAGLATGGFFLLPLSQKFGRSAVLLWALLGCLAAQVWALKMTKSRQYDAYVLSRWFAGFCGAIPAVIGPRMIFDILFLHQRGRIFNAFHICLDFGAVLSPTISAFTAARVYWPVEYWWNVGLLVCAIVLVTLTLEETAFDREDLMMNRKQVSWLQSRFDTFCLGTRTVPGGSFIGVLRSAARPVLIAISPVSLLLGCFTLINFGVFVAMSTLTPVWLQRPKKEGGFGFTVLGTATFSLAHLVGLVFALAYGHLLNDRLPLLIAARRGGIWQPEYRLHSLWIPSLILNPIGLGLFGATLEYRLHWIVLAVGQVLVTVGAFCTTPVIVNYICEAFTRYTGDAAVAMHLYRLAFGLSIPFYINAWVATVGVGWTYGMMAFFCIATCMFVVLLILKGHVIRGWSLLAGTSEEGCHVAKDTY